MFQDQAEREWLTWRQVCKQLEARGINPNDKKNEALITVIKLWAEEQAWLTHSTDKLHLAYNERTRLRAAYEEHVIGEWAP